MPSGAYVNAVNSGSCAEKAGLKAGDIITAIDDTAVSSGDALRSALRGYSAGESATLTVSRNGETLTLTVTFDRSQRQHEVSAHSFSIVHRRRVTAPPPQTYQSSFFFLPSSFPPSGKSAVQSDLHGAFSMSGRRAAR